MPMALTLTLAAAALATSGAALAEPGERPVREQAMTRDQASAMADRAFDRLDADGDGTIAEADRAARRQATFARLDADGDGVLSAAEFQTARAGREGRRDGRGERTGLRIGGMRQLARLSGAGAAADSNADNAISRDEFRAAVLARFAAADADQDGRVTAEERRQGRRRAGSPSDPAG